MSIGTLEVHTGVTKGYKSLVAGSSLEKYVVWISSDCPVDNAQVFSRAETAVDGKTRQHSWSKSLWNLYN